MFPSSLFKAWMSTNLIAMLVSWLITNVFLFHWLKKSYHLFSLIHTNVQGPSQIPNITGLIGLFLSLMIILKWRLYLLKNKSDGSFIFITFHKMIQTQFGFNHTLSSKKWRNNTSIIGYSTKKTMLLKERMIILR